MSLVSTNKWESSVLNLIQDVGALTKEVKDKKRTRETTCLSLRCDLLHGIANYIHIEMQWKELQKQIILYRNVRLFCIINQVIKTILRHLSRFTWAQTIQGPTHTSWFTVGT